jgi:hypothetical protein
MHDGDRVAIRGGRPPPGSIAGCCGPDRRRRYVPRVIDRSAAHSSPKAGETGFPHANCDQTRKHQQLLKEAANCGKMKSVKFAGKRLALGGEMLQDRKRGRGLAGSAAR